MRVRFHEAALAELEWEVQYYAKIDPKLGERFATVVERAIAIATEFPDMGDEILVLAIAPDDRKPGYWRSRIVQG